MTVTFKKPAEPKHVKFHASQGRLLVLWSLNKFGPQTDYELSDNTGWQQNSIGKRRLECQQAGLVQLHVLGGVKLKNTNKSGAKSLVWKLTSKGKRYWNSYGDQLQVGERT